MTHTLDTSGPIYLAETDYFKEGFPHDLFTKLRAEKPVVWSEEKNDRGFWVLTKYKDIEYVSRNPQLFSSATKNGGHRIFDEDKVGLVAAGEDNSIIGRPMISLDPPEHVEVRQSAMRGLTPAAMKSMEGRIRERISALLDAVVPSQQFDVISSLSAPIPIQTLVEILGCPPDMEADLYAWTNCLIGEGDPEFRQSPEHMGAVIENLIKFALQLLEAGKDGDGTDMISLISKTYNGTKLSQADFLGNFILLIIGGNETTRNTLSGGLLAFAEYPDQLSKLIANPELIPNAVKEILRWVSPVMHFRRTATEDVEIRGVKIAKGSKIVMWYPSANRDEEIWEHPFKFDIERKNNRHFTFGTGQHMCIGNRLGELQIRIFLEEFTKRFNQVELVGAAKRVQSNFLQGLKHLPMKFNNV
jgi:linalool 8-monooxygenase